MVHMYRYVQCTSTKGVKQKIIFPWQLMISNCISETTAVINSSEVYYFYQYYFRHGLHLPVLHSANTTIIMQGIQLSDSYSQNNILDLFTNRLRYVLCHLWMNAQPGSQKRDSLQNMVVSMTWPPWEDFGAGAIYVLWYEGENGKKLGGTSFIAIFYGLCPAGDILQLCKVSKQVSDLGIKLQFKAEEIQRNYCQEGGCLESKRVLSGATKQMSTKI